MPQKINDEPKVVVSRSMLRCLGLVVASSLLDDFASWTGWSIVVVFALTAKLVALVYGVLWLARR